MAITIQNFGGGSVPVPSSGSDSSLSSFSERMSDKADKKKREIERQAQVDESLRRFEIQNQRAMSGEVRAQQSHALNQKINKLAFSEATISMNEAKETRERRKALPDLKGSILTNRDIAFNDEINYQMQKEQSVEDRDKAIGLLSKGMTDVTKEDPGYFKKVTDEADFGQRLTSKMIEKVYTPSEIDAYVKTVTAPAAKQAGIDANILENTNKQIKDWAGFEDKYIERNGGYDTSRPANVSDITKILDKESIAEADDLKWSDYQPAKVTKNEDGTIKYEYEGGKIASSYTEMTELFNEIKNRKYGKEQRNLSVSELKQVISAGYKESTWQADGIHADRVNTLAEKLVKDNPKIGKKRTTDSLVESMKEQQKKINKSKTGNKGARDILEKLLPDRN